LPEELIKSLKKEYDEILAQWYVDQLELRVRNGESKRRKRSDGHNLIRRFQEYKEGVTCFLDDFDVPFTNNQAEQDIRMTKVKEKVSGGFKSSRGAENFAIIRSVTSTARKQGVNILQTICSPIHFLPSLLSI
jgi:transposase